jgi:hypothetical protein
MRKILSALTVVTLILPMVALAQVAPETCKISHNLRDIDSACYDGATVSMEDHGMCCLLNTVYNITDWIFVILVAVAALFVILGGVEIVTAGGAAEKVESGRKHIISAAIGLIVALLARAVPSIVKLVVGV